MDEFKESLPDEISVLQKYCTPDTSLPREAKNAVTWLDATAAASLSKDRFRRYMEVWQILCSDLLDEDFIGTFEQELRLSELVTACDVYVATVMHREDPSLVHKTYRTAGLLPKTYAEWVQRRKTGQIPVRERIPSPPPYEMSVPRLSEVLPKPSEDGRGLSPASSGSSSSTSSPVVSQVGDAPSDRPSSCWTGRKSSASSSSEGVPAGLVKPTKSVKTKNNLGKRTKSQREKSSPSLRQPVRVIPYSRQLSAAGRGALNAGPGEIARTLSWLCPFRVIAAVGEPVDYWFSTQRVKEWKYFPPIVLSGDGDHHDIDAHEHFSFGNTID